jgi:hypothetical protein
MSISSLPVAKFQFPWAREEEPDPREQKQIAALTAALQASLAREEGDGWVKSIRHSSSGTKLPQ